MAYGVLAWCSLQLKGVGRPDRVRARERDKRDEHSEREDQLERAVRFGRGPGRVLQPFRNVVVVALANSEPREPLPRLLGREDRGRRHLA